jgi:hypothetical protein
MWALVEFVIGEPINDQIVSAETKHIKYNRTGVMIIGGVNVYVNFIKMFK